MEALSFEPPLHGETNVVDSGGTERSKEMRSTSHVLLLPFPVYYGVHEMST